LTLLVGIILIAISAVLLIASVWQHASGKTDLVSLRNIAIIGFIVFQLSSVSIRMFNPYYASNFKLTQAGSSGFEFTVLVVCFLATFFLFYQQGWGVKKLALKVPVVPVTTNPAALITLAIALTLLAIPLRFAVNIPYIGVASNFIGVGSAAMACGLVGWVWAPRLFNPALAFFAVIFLALNLLNVMTGTFGRRSIVTVFGCMVWAMYYSHWRYIPTRKLLTRLAMLTAGPIIFLALYTSVRASAEHDRSAADHISEIQSGGSLVSGLIMLSDGQTTGPAGLWIIEHYPEDFAYRHLFTAKYFVGINVPRMIWPSKPSPLSTTLADKVNISGMDQDRIKLSCGVIGVAAAEGGFYAALVYGALGGLFLRFFDQIIRDQVLSPSVVMPIGAALGQVLGLARGDTSAFASTYFITTMGSLAIMIPIGRFMSRFELEHPGELDEYAEGPSGGYLDDPDQAV